MVTWRFFKIWVQPLLYRHVELNMPELTTPHILAHCQSRKLSRFADTKILMIREIPHLKRSERDENYFLSRGHVNELRGLGKDTRLVVWESYPVGAWIPLVQLFNAMIFKTLKHIPYGQIESFR